jgi:hypothetical protein
MGKKGRTKNSTTKVKSDKAPRLDADLPVKDAAAVKGGNLGPDNRQKKNITSTTTSTSV